MKPAQGIEYEMYCCKKADPTIINIAVDSKTLPCPAITTSGECFASPNMTPLSFCNEPVYQPSPLQIPKQRHRKNTFDFGCDHDNGRCTFNDDSESSNFQALPQAMSNNCNMRPHAIVSNSYVQSNFANIRLTQNDWFQFGSGTMRESPFVPDGQCHSGFYQPCKTHHDAMKTSIQYQNLTQVKKYDTVNLSNLEDDGKPLKTLSAYNFFFRHERERIIAGNDDHDGEYSFTRKEALLYDHWFRDRSKKRSHRKSHGKVSFAALSRIVAQRWKELPEHRKQFYQDLAAEDLRRYRYELIQREIGNKTPYVSSLKMCPEVHVREIVFKASSFFDLTPIPFMAEGYDR